MQADEKLSAIWERLCQLVQADSMTDIARLDATRAEPLVKDIRQANRALMADVPNLAAIHHFSY